MVQNLKLISPSKSLSYVSFIVHPDYNKLSTCKLFFVSFVLSFALVFSVFTTVQDKKTAMRKLALHFIP